MRKIKNIFINLLGAALLAAGSAGPALAQFTGDFSQPGGAVYDGGSEDQAHRVAVDTVALNGPFIYVAGTSEFDSQTTGLTAKYDKFGVLAASAVFTGPGSSFAVSDGIAIGADNIFVAGSVGGGLCVAQKYDKNLVFQSSATYSFSIQECVGNDITLSKTGNLYVTGHTGYTSEYRSLLIIKYDENLNFANAVTFSGGVYDKGMSIKTDDRGDVYAVGYSSAAGNLQILTLKYDPALVFISSAVFSIPAGSPEKRVSLSFGQDSVYVAGIDFDKGVLLKYSLDLVFKSSAAFNPGAASGWEGVGVNSLGDVFTTGNVFNGTDLDFLTAKYTPDLVFVSSIAYDGGHEDVALDVALDASDNLYVIGVSSNSLNNDWRTLRYPSSAFGAPAAPAGFTGNFAAPGGAGFDGGDMDYGTGTAFYGSNVYVVGISSSAGVLSSLIVKYDLAGNVVSSATSAAFGDAGFFDVKANANGVYVAAQGEGFLTVKYTPDLVFVSSAVLAGDSSARDLALDTGGNVYVIGSNWGDAGGNNDYKFVKYSKDLAQIGSPVTFNAGGMDEGRGIAVDNGNVYITGDSLIGNTTYFATAKFDSSSMAFISSASYAGGYLDGPAHERLAVNPVTHDVYLLGAQGPEGSSHLVTVKYSQNLQQMVADIFPGDGSSKGKVFGTDIKLDADGNVYSLGKDSYETGGITYEYALVVKYTPGLVFLSSAASSAGSIKYNGFAIALDTTTGYSYVTGLADDDAGQVDMRTVRFDPLGGVAPVAHAMGPNEFIIKETDVEDSGGFSAYGGGKFLVGYQHATSSITARLVLPDGTLVGSEITFNTTTEYGSGGWPAFAFGGTDFLMAWACDLPGYQGRIRGQRIDTSGNKVGSSFWISSTSGFDSHQLGNIAFDGVNYFVVWSASDTVNSYDNMYGQFVSTAGVLVGSRLTIGAGGKDGTVAYGHGKYLAAWRNDGNYGDVGPVKGRLILPNQIFGGTEFVIDASPAPSYNPVIVAADNTRFLVAFHDEWSAPCSEVNPDCSVSSHLFGKFVNADGTVAPSTFTISDSPDAQFLPEPVWDGSKYLITWNDADGLSTATVHMRYFDASGNPLDADTVIASAVSGRIPFSLGFSYDSADKKFFGGVNRYPVTGSYDDATTDLYGLILTTTSSGAGFTGNFSESGGAVYDGGNSDVGADIALNPATDDTYVVGASSVSGLSQGLVIKYNAAGVMVASAPVTDTGGMYLSGVALNGNGIYVAGGVYNTNNFVVKRYGPGLNLISSAVLPGVHTPRVALDGAGNVYLAGSSDGDHNYHLAKYGLGLGFISSTTFDAGGVDRAIGVAVDNGYAYVTGYALISNSTYYVTAKFDAGSLAFVSSVSYANAYAEGGSFERLAVNPVTHEVYLVGTHGTENNRQMVTVKYSQTLQQLGEAIFPGGSYGLGADVKLDTAGNVYALGKEYNGSDYAFVAKYNSALVFLSSAASASVPGSFTGMAVALDTTTGNSYVTGIKSDGGIGPKDPTNDIRTVRFAPLGGVAPVVHAKGPNEFVISETDGRDSGGSVAYGNGNFLTVYQKNDVNVEARLFDTSGNPVGAEIVPAGNTDCQAGQGPAVAFDGTNFLMTWGCRLLSNTSAIRGQRVDSSGNTIGSAFAISAFTGSRGDGDVAFDGTNYFAVWSSTESGAWNIYGQFISATGALVNSRITIATPATAWIDHTPVKYAGGKYLVTWTEGNNVKGRMVLPNGSLYGSEIAVNVDSLTSDGPTVIAYDPGSAKFLVTYNNGINVNSRHLYGRFVDLSGVAGSSFTITEAAGNQFGAVPVWDGSKYLITWSDGYPLSTATVHKRNFSGAGIPLDTDAIIASNESGKVPLSIASAIAGGKVFVLVNRGDIGSYNDASLDLYGLIITTTAIQQAAGFTGNFSQADGAGFDGGAMDFGTAAAFYGSNVYVVGLSSPTGAIIVKYDLAGNVVSSATLGGLESFDGVAVNANGVYAAGKGVTGTGFVTAKYNYSLTLTSAAVLPGQNHARDLALDTGGNVYVVGANDTETGYKFVKYSADLAQQGSPVVFNAGGAATGRGIAVDSGNIYVTGDSLIGAATYYVTARYNSSLAFVSSVAYAGGYSNSESLGAKLAINAATHEVYFVGTHGAHTDLIDSNILTIKYSQNLVQLAAALAPHYYAEGTDIALDNAGNVYTLGVNQVINNGPDYPVVLKYNSDLVFLSSATRQMTNWYAPFGLALDNATGESYVTGLDDGGGISSDMRTVRFAPLGGSVPVVYISTRDVSPAVYLAGQEAAALRITPHTLSGTVSFTGLQIAVNPAGAYANVASAALYADLDSDQIWNPRNDLLLSSGAVTSAGHYFDLSGMGGVIDPDTVVLFITLTPAISAVDSSINVAVPSSASFHTNGDMAQQTIYPITSTPTLVTYLAGLTDLTAEPGANLNSVSLSWTYPQDITSGHYIIRYSTNTADLDNPNLNAVTGAISGITAGAYGSYTASGLTPVTSGLRVFPYYFAVWLYNGISTSAVSSTLARNLYFPAAAVSDKDAALTLRTGMSLTAENAARFAKSTAAAGAYSALTFYDGGKYFIALNTPDGKTQFYYDQTYLALRDLAADPAGNAYGLIQKANNVSLVVKLGPDGAVLWTSPFTSSSSETARALTYGAGAVYYAATGFQPGSAGQDIKLRKLRDTDGALLAVYSSSPAGSYDEVNSLAFVQDASGKYVYAAGASGSPLYGMLYKFADTGTAFSVSPSAVAGSWPVRYVNPGGGDARALAVKADSLNNTLVVVGAEQRNDLNQGSNIWLNRYGPYGAPIFANPTRYNNAQSNSDDIPVGLDFDSFGNIYVSGYTDMWNLGQGYNMLLGKFGPGGQFLSARIYDSGSGSNDTGAGVLVSTNNYAYVAGMFGAAGTFGVYSLPLGSSVNAQFFTAAEGPYTGSADLTWNYTGSLPAGSTYYVQYSTALAPVWSRASAQLAVNAGPSYSGAVQSQRLGGLPALRYPGQDGQETRGNAYKFKVWITSGGLTTELPVAQTFARTPSAYDNTQYFGRERLSYMSGLSGPGGGIAVDGTYVYHAFGGSSEGGSAGFGLRKYNTDQYLEWTKFFNHAGDRAYNVANVTRDAAGNFYLVGSQRLPDTAAGAPDYLAADKDLWIAKLDAAGDLVWSYSADASGINQMDELYDVAVEEIGAQKFLYVTGVAATVSSGLDMVARKYDVSQSTYIAPLWTYSEPGAGEDVGYGVAVGTGAVYLSGAVFNTDKDIIVRALSKTSGLPVGGPIVINSGHGDDAGYDLAVTTAAPGYIYVAGSVGTASEGTNAALFKYSLAGALVWDRYYNGRAGADDALLGVKASGSGVIVAGYETTYDQGKNSIYRKFSAAGTEEWSRGFDFAGGGDDEAHTLALDASGRVYSTVSLWSKNPGFYYFPEPSFGLMAAANYVPGSVRLDWMSQYEVPAGSLFSIQYSTNSGQVWDPAGAQVRFGADAYIRAGMNVTRAVYGLDNGRDMQGAPVGPGYFFRVWFSTAAGIFTPVPGVASARASDGWAFENMVMYPNEAKLFVMGNNQQGTSSVNISGEKELPGIARDAAGSLYMLANMDWNSSGGFAIKKFSSALTPVWTRYYAPGERFAVKANRMAADAEGNLYLTGYERGPDSSNGKDIFVMKFGSGGLVWKSTYNFAGGDDTGYGVALDASGNVYVAGSVYTGSDDDIFAAKFSPAGVLLDTVTYSGSGSGPDAAYGIAVQDANLYLTGSSYETDHGSHFWTGLFSSSGLDQLGTSLTGGDAAGSGYDVAVDTLGYVYAAGEIYGADTANDALVTKSYANLDAVPGAYPIRYNSPGNANDAAYGLAIDAAGSVYVTGSQERYDINQDKNLWIRKYARDGSELWSQEFHSNAIPGDPYSAGANSDEGFSLAVGTMGFVSVSGRFNDYYGLYRYRQTSTLAVNPTLTVVVSSASCSSCASFRFGGVGVALIPYSQTGGIDAASIRSSVTSPSGTASFQVPSGKQYFIALDKQGYNPNIKDQQMDPYGNFFVQLNADITKQYTLSPRPASDPYYPLTVTVTSATASDYIMAEVFFTQTGEKAAYGIAQVPVNRSSVTFTVANVPPADAGAYTLGVTIPGRGLARSLPMNALFPQTSSYIVNMSTSSGAVATTGGFDVGASTTPPSVEGVARNAGTWAPVEGVRVRMWNSVQNCMSGNCDYNVYETLTDVTGKYSFYNVVSTPAYYNLSAQKAGYKRAWDGGLTIAANAATIYREFRLEESTYTLRGVIRYRDVPVPNADVMVWGDYSWYQNGSDSYRGGRGMDTDARTKTGADGSFVFSGATLNGLPDGQLRMNVSFFGNWVDLNQGNNQSSSADDVRIIISSDSATGAGNCAKGRVWKLLAESGACQESGDINFNIMPQAQNDYATLSGSVTFVTTYTVSGTNPLVISSMAPVTVMAMQECSGDCKGRSMGFAVISGTYELNTATYSITLSTGISYYTRITSNEWGETSAFDDRADFRSTTTLSVVMNFVITKAGSMKGVVKMPDGSNYKPNYNFASAEQYHRIDINVAGQNVNVNEGWSVDDYGAFEFPNLAPGLYTITMRPQGLGFHWAAPALTGVAVVAGKTTQVTLKLEDGLVVQPQIIGLPEISTPTWSYLMIPVESGTEMNQKKITEMFFGSDVFAFNYSTSTHLWDKKVMLTGQYDFYLMMGARYSPEGGNNQPLSFDQFGNFIGKVKGFAVQRVENSPNLGTEAQPIPVNVLGSLGQDSFGGTIVGERVYTDADLDRIFSNMNEIYPVIPTVMVYDAAGDLRGYTAGLPGKEDFNAFWNALLAKDKAQMKAYFAAHPSRFMVPGLPPGRYTVVFSNPNYPPIAKELDIPLASSFNGVYAFNFEEQSVRTGDIYGTVRSSATGLGLPSAVVYLKHRTVEKFADTAADGSYSFSNLPPGIYRLEVTREGFVKTGQKTSLTGSLTGDDESKLDFYLTPSQTNMTGKVYLSKFPAPLTKSGVKIVAYDETYNTEHPSDYLPKIEATTNDSGEYEIAGVVPGHNYRVSAFYGGKLPATLDVSGDAVTEGVTYLPDIVLREVPPQIMVKVRKSPDSVNKVDVTIKSPKQLVSTPVCKVNPGELYVSSTAVSLALVPGPNNTYEGQFTVSRGQAFYNVHVSAGDGSNKMEKSVTYSPNNQAKTEQYIQDEAIQGGEVQMDKESEEYSGLELDAGGLSYSTFSATASQDFGNLVGGFFSALPSVRTIKTAKGDLNITQAMQDLMASEVYNMELENASANKPFTLTLKYDKEKAGGNGNLRIYQYDDASAGWKEVPGDYTTDPMLGVLSVGVAGLSNAHEGTRSASTPLGRKRFGMSAVVNGRYVPSAAGTSQSGRFAVFTANPPTGTAAFSSALVVYNMPNPFNLKSKSVSLGTDIGSSGIANPYPTNGTVIKYNLPAGKSGNLKFVIYNMAGEKVRTIDEGSRTGGQIYYSEWDGRNDTNQECASGVYFMLTYMDGKKLGTKAHKLAIIK